MIKLKLTEQGKGDNFVILKQTKDIFAMILQNRDSFAMLLKINIALHHLYKMVTRITKSK